MPTNTWDAACASFTPPCGEIMKWIKKALGKTGRKVAEGLVMKGYIAAREGRLVAARQHYADAIDADDTLAVAYFNAGQVELELFNKAGSEAPEDVDDARTRRLLAAADHLRKGLDRDPGHAPSWRTLARVSERQGDYVAAVDAWTQARARLAVADPPADPTELEEARREASRLQPFAELAAVLQKARAALATEVDVDATVLALNALQATWERSLVFGVAEPPRFFTLVGALARKLGDLEQARTSFETAIARDKHDLEALRELATICLTQGDLKAALASSLAAYRADPVDAGLVCNVGVCHLALGELEQAREFIGLAAGMAPKDPIIVKAVAALGAAR